MTTLLKRLRKCFARSHVELKPFGAHLCVSSKTQLVSKSYFGKVALSNYPENRRSYDVECSEASACHHALNSCAMEWFQRGLAAHEKREYFKAIDAWKRAAEQGDVEAQYRIGLLYARGEGVIQSIPDAVIWFKRACRCFACRSAISTRQNLS